MATKPVISIDVDSSKFDAFFKLFQSYNAALEEQPGAWDALNDSIAGAGEALKKSGASGEEALSKAAGEAERVTIHLRQAGLQQQMLGRATAAHKRGFQDLGRAGKGAWQAIGGAADASLAKTASGLTGILSALGPIGIGVGTILGAAVAGVTAAKSIADAAVARQRSAMSLGVLPGRQAAFGVYGQQFFGDGQAALQSAANVQSNFGNAGALGALGIDFNKARMMSKSDLAFEMLRQGVRIAQASPTLPYGNNPLLAQYAALTGDKDFDQLRNAVAMGPQALDKAQAAVAQNTSSMNISRKAVRDAATLKMAAEGAEVRGQSWLINNTTGIDPGIAKGLDAISGDPRAQAQIKTALETLGNTIDQKTVPAMQNFNHALNTSSGGLLHQAKVAINTANAWFNNATGGWGTTGGMMIVGPNGELGPVPGKTGSGSAAAALKGAAAVHALGGNSPINNPLNMKILSGGDLKWGQYGSVDEGIRANAKRLLQYKSDWGADTLATLIPIWNGHGANSGSYIDNVEKWSGVSRNASLHGLTQSQFAAVESAMSREEGTSPVSSNQVMNALFAQRRNTRDTVHVNVTNSTQARVAVSTKAANP